MFETMNPSVAEKTWPLRVTQVLVLQHTYCVGKLRWHGQPKLQFHLVLLLHSVEQ